MNYATRAAALVFACLVFAAAPAKPPALDIARQTLVKAIAAQDWMAVSSLTAWPLAVDNYGSPPTLAKTKFLKNPQTLSIYFGGGDKDLLHCAQTAPLSYQGDKKQFGFGSWVADCNGNEFYFGMRGGKALFTAYQNVNE